MQLRSNFSTAMASQRLCWQTMWARCGQTPNAGTATLHNLCSDAPLRRGIVSAGHSDRIGITPEGPEQDDRPRSMGSCFPQFECRQDSRLRLPRKRCLRPQLQRSV
eukprot:520771-Amphidinium_carterae.1